MKGWLEVNEWMDERMIVGEWMIRWKDDWKWMNEWMKGWLEVYNWMEERMVGS